MLLYVIHMLLYMKHMLLYVIYTFLLFKKIVEERQRKSKKRSSQIVKMTLWEPHGGQLSGRRDNVQRIGSVKAWVCSLTSHLPQLPEYFHVAHPSLKEVFLCSFPPTETTFLSWTHVKIMTYCQPHGVYLEKVAPREQQPFCPPHWKANLAAAKQLLVFSVQLSLSSSKVNISEDCSQALCPNAQPYTR